MGADGFVRDPDRALGYWARCYSCGRTMDPDEIPSDLHGACAQKYGGRIGVMEPDRPVDDLDNFESRGWP